MDSTKREVSRNCRWLTPLSFCAAGPRVDLSDDEIYHRIGSNSPLPEYEYASTFNMHLHFGVQL